MDIREIRSRNFRHLVDALEEKGIKGRRDQGAQLGGFLSPSYVSQLLGGKYIGDDVAKKISQALGKDHGWMDRPQWSEDGEASVSPIPENETPPAMFASTCLKGVRGWEQGWSTRTTRR